VLGLVCLLSLAAPDSARAIDPNPLHAIGGVLGAGADAVTGGIGKLAVDGFGGSAALSPGASGRCQSAGRRSGTRRACGRSSIRS
jgi:hypothetical protein